MPEITHAVSYTHLDVYKRQMLQYAKIGVAMGNAVLELKQHAYMVTDDIGYAGVAHAMLKLGLI